MSPSSFLKLFGVAIGLFLVIDLAWLGFLARGFYREHLGHLLRADVNWGAAAAFYLLYAAGIVVFVVQPALDRGSLWHAVLLGGFFGLVAYAAYDLTNLATLQGFPAIVAVVDLAWGFALSAAVAGGTYLAGARIL